MTTSAEVLDALELAVGRWQLVAQVQASTDLALEAIGYGVRDALALVAEWAERDGHGRCVLCGAARFVVASVGRMGPADYAEVLLSGVVVLLPRLVAVHGDGPPVEGPPEMPWGMPWPR